MDNRIFFNPGDSIANINDYNEAVRKGQIFKKEQHTDDLVIAKGPATKNMPSSTPRMPCRPTTTPLNLMMSNKSSKKTARNSRRFNLLVKISLHPRRQQFVPLAG